MRTRNWWRIVDPEAGASIISTPASKRPGDCGYDEDTLSAVLQLSREPGEFDDVDEETGLVTPNAERKAATLRRGEICSIDRAELVDRLEEMVAEAVTAAIAELFPNVKPTAAQRAAIRARSTLRTGK